MKMADMKEPGIKPPSVAEAGHPDMPDEPRYPHTMRLGPEHLKALGLNDGNMPAVGAKVNLHAHGHVVEHRTEGKGKHHITLELRKMAVEGPKSGASDVEQAQQSAKGAKAEMDKALMKGQGSASKGNGENG